MGNNHHFVIRRNLVLTVQLICTLVSAAILLLTAGCGLVGGLRKGALHSLVKLGALVLSVVIALIISLCLRNTVTDLVVAFLPDILSDYEGLVRLVVQLPASIGLLVVFWLILTIVRLLMLIPQKLICKLLPRSFDDIRFKPKTRVVTVEAPVEQPMPEALTTDPATEDPAADTVEANADSAADAPDPLSDTLPDSQSPDLEPSAPVSQPVEAPVLTREEEVEVNRLPYKILWKVSAALCGALSSVLLLGAFLMPVSGLLTRAGDAVYRVTDTMANENYGKYSDEISEYAHAISSAPLFTVTDFFYGKTVFEPLTTFETDYGKVSLSSELENAADLVCEALPIVIHLQNEGTVRSDDVGHLTATAERLSESEFLMSVATYFVNRAGDEMGESSDKPATAGKQALQDELSTLMSDMESDELSASLDTVISLIDELADSPLLKALTTDDAVLKPADLADREMLQNLFGILYDDPNTQTLLVPLMNFATESVFQSMNAEPVYSNADINQISRDEILAEAGRICDAAEGLAAFAESVDAEGSDISTYRLKEAGKALDSLKASVFFGDQYDSLVDSLTTTAAGENADSSLMNALGDALREGDSAEALLNSAQSLAVMSKALQSEDKKGSENEELMSSMDVLLNQTTAENADTLSGIAGDHFFSDTPSVNAETQSQMIEDYMSALVTVSAQEEKDVAAEADAMQVVYDIAHSNNSNAFEKVSEEEAIDKLLDSDIAFEMLKKLNTEGRDYGIRAKLTDANRAKINAAIEASDATADRKEAVETFFNVD